MHRLARALLFGWRALLVGRLGPPKKRRSEMSRWPVEYSAAWLLSYDQAMTAEDHKICQAAPDLEIRQCPRRW